MDFSNMVIMAIAKVTVMVTKGAMRMAAAGGVISVWSNRNRNKNSNRNRKSQLRRRLR